LADLLLAQAVFAGADLDAELTAAEPVVTPAAQAAAIIAEVEVARRLSGSDDGAVLRGLVYLAAAKAQADFALVHMVDERGFFRSGEWSGERLWSTRAAPLIDQYGMLEALSLLTNTVSPDGDYSAPYGDPAFVEWFRSGATKTLDAVLGENPTEIGELAAAIRAIGRYQEVTDSPSDVGVLLNGLLTRLADYDPTSLADRALIAATLLNHGPPELASAALELAAPLLDGSVVATDKWAGDDISVMITGLDALSSYADWDRGGEAETVLAEFVMSVVMPGDLEADELGAQFPIGGLASFDMAYDKTSQRWHPINRTFNTAVSLRVSAALSRLATFRGSQEQPAPQANVALPQGPTLITITTKEFSFTPSVLEVPQGAEVTLRLENGGQIAHNVRIDGLDVFVEAEPGSSTELTFTTPSGSGIFEFMCDIPGHADGGMRGEIQLIPIESPEPNAPTISSESRDEQPGPVVASATLGGSRPPSNPASRASVPAIVLASGFIIGMLIFTVALVSFSKNAALQEQQPVNLPD
jgi:uncharacterized cupredoxin-like copper-binding protein